MDSISYDHISGKFLSYDKDAQSIFLIFRLYIYSILMSRYRNIFFHRKSGFHPTRKHVGFMPQFITRVWISCNFKFLCAEYPDKLRKQRYDFCCCQKFVPKYRHQLSGWQRWMLRHLQHYGLYWRLALDRVHLPRLPGYLRSARLRVGFV